MLGALQRMPEAAAFLDRPRSAGQWDTTIPQPPAKRPRSCRPFTTSISSRDSASVRSAVAPVTWTVSDIVKAASLLHEPPMDVSFEDEQEMRRVYTLIYDVFRYKKVLDQALTDVSFYYLFPQLRQSKHLVWLLLYDLYHRRFQEREMADGSASTADRLFPTCNLREPETALWATRIRLAAAMSRLRIANSALRLSDMLPFHLRDEKIIKASNMIPVTFWVNKNKIGGKSPQQFFEEVRTNFSFKSVVDENSNLNQNQMKWDPLCPLFLSFHHSQRQALAKSYFIQENILIMQNRSFCLGAALFCKLLFQYNLTGAVIQSHITSPRATAYLATLLTGNDQILRLLVFGAGDKKAEFTKYFHQMNIKNITLFEENLSVLSPETQILEQVVAVFATPPNSYSAVTDPIDLICSRGGDLAMLHILTDTNDSEEGRKRIETILEQQRMSLRYSMSRPQIQFVLYETHSQLQAENEDMAVQVIAEVNRAAKYKHAELLGKIPSQTTKHETSLDKIVDENEINNNEMKVEIKSDFIESVSEVIDSKITVESSDTTNTIRNEEEIFKNIVIPPTDIFEIRNLPDLCHNSDQCLSLASEGCYLALLQRKEVTRLDAKYMIKMAESRGLFGDNNPETAKKQTRSSKPRKKEKQTISHSAKRKRGTFEVERIGAQTHASLMRSCPQVQNEENSDMIRTCCRKHIQAPDNQPSISPAKLWWAETTRYLTNLKKSLIRQKILSNRPKILNALNSDKLSRDIHNIDEILTCVDKLPKKGANIPVFPKLRLTRDAVKIEKIPFPVKVQTVELLNS